MTSADAPVALAAATTPEALGVSDERDGAVRKNSSGTWRRVAAVATLSEREREMPGGGLVAARGPYWGSFVRGRPALERSNSTRSKLGSERSVRITSSVVSILKSAVGGGGRERAKLKGKWHDSQYRVAAPLRRLTRPCGRPVKFGALRFPASNRQPAKWVCVGERSSMDDVASLLFETWKLPRPSVIISVTGAASRPEFGEEFNENDQLNFRQGLLKAVQTAKAWVVTGGTATGVMGMVGEMVHEAEDPRDVICLGIATWGIVKNHEVLDEAINGRVTPRDGLSCLLRSRYSCRIPTATSSSFGIPDVAHTVTVTVGDDTVVQD